MKNKPTKETESFLDSCSNCNHFKLITKKLGECRNIEVMVAYVEKNESCEKIKRIEDKEPLVFKIKKVWNGCIKNFSRLWSRSSN